MVDLLRASFSEEGRESRCDDIVNAQKFDRKAATRVKRRIEGHNECEREKEQITDFAVFDFQYRLVWTTIETLLYFCHCQH